MRPQHSAAPEIRREASPPGAASSDLGGPFEVTLDAALGAPAAARRAVASWMDGHVGETLRADVQAVVVELVTNSVRHADAPDDAVVSVRAEVRADVLRVEVEDRGTGGSIARRAPDLRDGGGFGLHLVDLLSRRWGVDRDAGTCVWAELAFPAAG
ncbi:MAG TPA: ATP-binding protein [Solirubrobacteraceae bacterium]|nr:ATP-binding protein [Solirubrobacteraceae bacterium]